MASLADGSSDLLGVKITGIVMGVAFLWIAIRMLFGKRKK
jgi:hypothetical protein